MGQGIVQPDVTAYRRGAILVLQFGLDDLGQDDGDLGDAERERARALRTPELRRRYVHAHAVMRAALATVIGCAPNRVNIATGAHGKPWLPDQPGVHFNLSHSAGQAMLALGPGPLGVDLEQVTPQLADDEALAAWVLEPERLPPWRAASPADRADLLCRTWTLKEACVKARGDGLMDIRLSTLRLPSSGVGPVGAPIEGQPHWWVRPLPAPWGYHAALCTRGMSPPPQLLRLAGSGWQEATPAGDA